MINDKYVVTVEDKAGQEYNIHDIRIPEITAEDNGKVLVANDGAISLGTGLVGPTGPAGSDANATIQTVAVGAFTAGSASITDLTTLMAKYSHVIIYGHHQYAPTVEMCAVIDLTAINSGTTYTLNGWIKDWDRNIPIYVFKTSGYIDWNSGNADAVYITAILGITK